MCDLDVQHHLQTGGGALSTVGCHYSFTHIQPALLLCRPFKCKISHFLKESKEALFSFNRKKPNWFTHWEIKKFLWQIFEQVRLVSVEAEHPNHPSPSTPTQTWHGCLHCCVQLWGGGGSSMTMMTQTWLHKADSTRSRARPKNYSKFKFLCSVLQGRNSPSCPAMDAMCW